MLPPFPVALLAVVVLLSCDVALLPVLSFVLCATMPVGAKPSPRSRAAAPISAAAVMTMFLIACQGYPRNLCSIKYLYFFLKCQPLIMLRHQICFDFLRAACLRGSFSGYGSGLGSSPSCPDVASFSAWSRLNGFFRSVLIQEIGIYC